MSTPPPQTSPVGLEPQAKPAANRSAAALPGVGAPPVQGSKIVPCDVPPTTLKC